MKLSKLNESLTLLANIGVIAGIVFLAIEVQQNTSMMQAQTRDSITQSILTIQEWNTDISNVELMARGVAGQIETDTLEWGAFRSRVEMTLRAWENELYQYEQGLFEEDEFLPRTTVWQGALKSPGFRKAWESVQYSYSVSFQNKVDEITQNSED